MALGRGRPVFHGSKEAGVEGIIDSSSNAAVDLPADVTKAPDAVSKALTDEASVVLPRK